MLDFATLVTFGCCLSYLDCVPRGYADRCLTSWHDIGAEHANDRLRISIRLLFPVEKLYIVLQYFLSVFSLPAIRRVHYLLCHRAWLLSKAIAPVGLPEHLLCLDCSLMCRCSIPIFLPWESFDLLLNLTLHKVIVLLILMVLHYLNLECWRLINKQLWRLTFDVALCAVLRVLIVDRFSVGLIDWVATLLGARDIHLWLLASSRLVVGQHTRRCKFIDHFLTIVEGELLIMSGTPLSWSFLRHLATLVKWLLRKHALTVEVWFGSVSFILLVYLHELVAVDSLELVLRLLLIFLLRRGQILFLPTPHLFVIPRLCIRNLLLLVEERGGCVLFRPLVLGLLMVARLRLITWGDETSWVAAVDQLLLVDAWLCYITIEFVFTVILALWGADWLMSSYRFSHLEFIGGVVVGHCHEHICFILRALLVHYELLTTLNFKILV